MRRADRRCQDGEPDRVTALIARAGAYVRKEMPDSAIGDYDVALLLDPSQADIFNTRGELWRTKGDRRRALADFAAAIKLNPDHPTAKASYKSLAQELERAGAQMAVAGKPSFNCATSKRQVEKAICANPELADLDREINATFLKVIARPESDSHRASTALTAGAAQFHRQAQCLVRPAGLRFAQGHEGAAGQAQQHRPAVRFGRTSQLFRLDLSPLPVTMTEEQGRLSPSTVMAGLVPAIHVLRSSKEARRGCPAQGRA